ncbi:MAG: SDR family oxidoreductase [Thermodesulfobacteriota bacterium]
MNLGIEGKRALITGASRGIGRAIALGLAREGAKVAGIARSEQELVSLLHQLGGESASHVVKALDLMENGAPETLLTWLTRVFGLPDIVVHNLGGADGVTDPFPTASEWRRVWRLNLEIALEINRIVIPEMQKRGWGRVVHVSSIAPVRGRSSVPYATLKAAVNAYVASLGRAVAADNVIVTAVMPGAVLTEGNKWTALSAKDPEAAADYANQRLAIKRFGRPGEVSDLVVFLCSERASFAPGAVMPIDGGTW